MNLGAPILDVQVEIKTSDKTGAAAATPSKPVSIVSGGVVSAPGYTPIVITKVTPQSYSNGGATGFNTATPVATPTAPSAAATAMSNNKIGSAGHDVFSHNTSKFNPNVRIIVNKKTSKPINPKAGQK